MRKRPLLVSTCPILTLKAVLLKREHIATLQTFGFGSHRVVQALCAVCFRDGLQQRKQKFPAVCSL